MLIQFFCDVFICLMFERQIYLKLVGVFVTIHFQFPFKNLINLLIKPLDTDSLSFYHSVFSPFPLILFLSFFHFVFLSFCLYVFSHLSSYKFIFVQSHLSIFLSFPGLYWAVVLDDLKWS